MKLVHAFVDASIVAAVLQDRELLYQRLRLGRGLAAFRLSMFYYWTDPTGLNDRYFSFRLGSGPPINALMSARPSKLHVSKRLFDPASEAENA